MGLLNAQTNPLSHVTLGHSVWVHFLYIKTYGIVPWPSVGMGCGGGLYIHAFKCVPINTSYMAWMYNARPALSSALSVPVCSLYAVETLTQKPIYTGDHRLQNAPHIPPLRAICGSVSWECLGNHDLVIGRFDRLKTGSTVVVITRTLHAGSTIKWSDQRLVWRDVSSEYRAHAVEIYLFDYGMTGLMSIFWNGRRRVNVCSIEVCFFSSTAERLACRLTVPRHSLNHCWLFDTLLSLNTSQKTCNY